jgi:hypothetical protein
MYNFQNAYIFLLIAFMSVKTEGSAHVYVYYFQM